MPVIKGRKELGSKNTVLPVAHARAIDSAVADHMATGTPNRQGKGKSLEGRQPKTGETQRTRDAKFSRDSLKYQLARYGTKLGMPKP